MLLLTLQFSWLEIIVLQIGALILGCTIYFFYVSRRSLQQAMQGSAGMRQRTVRKSLLEQFALKNEVMSSTQHQIMRPSAVTWPDPLVVDKRNANEGFTFITGSQEAAQSYTTVSTLMQRVEQLEALAGTRHLSVDLHQRIEELEAALSEKAAALQQVRHQETIARQMADRLEEVFQDFDALQQKLITLEAQAAATQEQAIEMEDLQRAYNLMQKDLVRKQDKLEAMAAENQRLQQELVATSNQLIATSQQRQQASQRSRAMHEMQADIETISEGQSKLQQQLRHISELETMLEQYGGKTK